MSKVKHRGLTGVLALVCLLTGMAGTVLPTGDSIKTLAQTEKVPDLIIEGIAVSPELPAIGYTVAFTVTVRNQGDYPAGSYRLAGFIDDSPLNIAWISGTNPGLTTEKTFTWKARAGPHIFKAVVDYDNSIDESGESNNDSTFAFSVLASDLVVSDIAWVPENPSAGDKVTFTVTVHNQGDKIATGSQVSLYIDGQCRGYKDIYSIEAGENRTATYYWLATAGTYDIEAEADRLNQVKESDETNNHKTVTYATAAPDLVIDNITWSPVNRSVSSNVTMTVKVTNQGSGKAGYSWLGYYIDDTLQGADFIGPLKADASITKTFSWKAGAGTHVLKAVADYRDELIENNEINNTMFVTLPSILPDLIIQSITRSPVKPATPDQAIYVVTVKNQGKFLSGPCDLNLYVDEIYMLKQEVPLLDSGDTTMVLFKWISQTEPVTLRAVVDEDNIISENSETNNSKTVKIGAPKTTPNVDLVIESMAWTPTNPAVNDTVTITIAIKNKGPGKVGPSHVDYYVDDVFLDSVYAPEILAGRSIVNSVLWQAQTGEHTIKAAVDCNNLFFETDEENNEKSVTLAVAAPDLIIQDVRWSPTDPEKGEEVAFTLTVKNQGDSTAMSSYVNYYVDGSSRGSHFIDNLAPGDTAERAFTWRTQTEAPVFRIVIDEDNDIVESDESNNEVIVNLPAPDLTIEEITRSPEYPSENATVTFIVKIANLGTGVAKSPKISGYIDDAFLASIQFSDISPNGTATGACIWTAANGTHIFRAVADVENAIAESDEGNNEAMLTLSISEPVEGQSQEAELSDEGEEIAPGVTAKNVDVIEMMMGENYTAEEDIAEDISSTAPTDEPWWQKILMNRLLIIGVGGTGAAALVVLIILRRRGRKPKAAAEG
jgi:subtilase family serine protease